MDTQSEMLVQVDPKTGEVLDTVHNQPDVQPVWLYKIMSDLCTEHGFGAWPVFLTNAAHEWLVQEAYLTRTPNGTKGKWDYLPTVKGTEAGLYAGAIDRDGATCMTTCGTEAVRGLLRDNFDRFMALERRQWDPLLACLTPEWRNAERFTAEPVSLQKALTNLIGGLDISRRPNSATTYLWLARKGLVERVLNGKQRGWQPTETGKAAGILPGSGGRACQWPAAAQRYLRDNMEQMVRDMASGEAFRAWAKFVPTAELISRLRQDPTAGWPTGFERAVNAALDPETERLPWGAVRSWLLAREYVVLERRPGSAAWTIRPTNAGTEIGLGLNDKGYITMTEVTQRFLADHLEDIFSYSSSQ